MIVLNEKKKTERESRREKLSGVDLFFVSIGDDRDCPSLPDEVAPLVFFF